MDTLEKLIKASLLFAFCLLNAIDTAQTLAFLRMGIEGNLFARNNPQLWLVLKLAFTFGLPIGVFRLDLYLESKDDEGLFSYLKGLVSIVYLVVLFADIYYLSLVLRNTAILGRLIP